MPEGTGCGGDSATGSGMLAAGGQQLRDDDGPRYYGNPAPGKVPGLQQEEQEQEPPSFGALDREYDSDDLLAALSSAGSMPDLVSSSAVPKKSGGQAGPRRKKGGGSKSPKVVL